MDARNTPRWGLLLLPFLALGCEGIAWPPPAAHQDTAPAQAQEPPQVVDGAATPSDADGSTGIDGAIAKYIKRMEGAIGHGGRRPAAPPPGADGARYVADLEFPPASQPSVPGPAHDEPQPAPPKAAPSAEAPTDAPATPSAPLTPPVLTDVAIHAAPGFEVTRPEPGAAEINTALRARSAPTSLREFLDQVPPPEQASFREQLDLCVLRVIAGQYEQARAPLSLVTAEQQELASRFVEALIAIREGHMGDLSAAASAAAQELAKLQESLRRLSDLNVPVLKICSAVRSYGQYDVIDPPRFVAGGGEFVLYCELRDFVSEKRADDYYYTKFDLTTTLLTRSGDSVLEVKDTDITDRCRNLRHDCFIPRLVRLPATLSPGPYVAKITVVDKLGQKVAESCAPFQIVARP